MTSKKPYMLRAFYEWISDNHLTPYIIVDATLEGVDVPEKFINEDGEIVLNIGQNAVRDLQIKNDKLYFQATFSGEQRWVYAPMKSVRAIYAKENNDGIAFNDEEEGDDTFPENLNEEKTDPHLKIVDD